MSALAHFDIVIWSYHTDLLIGILCLLLSIMCTTSFLCSDREPGSHLLTADILLLTSMYCYESFFFLPLIVFSAAALYSRLNHRNNKKILIHMTVVYIVYGFSYLLYQKYRTFYPASVTTLHFVLNSLTWEHMLKVMTVIVTNLLYVNILVNFLPWTGGSLEWDTKVLMLNYNTNFIHLIESHSALAVVIIILVGAALVIYLRKTDEKARSHMIIAGAIVCLLLGYLGILAFGRTLTNTSIYIYRQFRYQIFPDMCVLAFTAVILGAFIKRKGDSLVKGIAVTLLIISISANVYLTQKAVGAASMGLRPLSVLIKNISDGLQQNKISKTEKLYVDPSIVIQSGLWNTQACNFPGTIQWYFKDSQDYFTFEPAEAAWVVEKDMTIRRTDLRE